MFGASRRKDLEAENIRLRNGLGQLGALDVVQLTAHLDGLRSRVAAEGEQLMGLQQQVAAARSRLVEMDDIALLQEAGIYSYRHPLKDAVAYKQHLAAIKDKAKAAVRGQTAVQATTRWQVDGSARAGMAMVRDFSKLMLRAYNAEADNCVRTVRSHSLATTVQRLDKTRDIIARLGKTMSIRISDSYHSLRISELELTADYLAKVDEERERARAERERQRDEEAAQREIERERARLQREQTQYETAHDQLLAKGDLIGAEQLRNKIAEIVRALDDVAARAANLRLGHVYVISNFGAFGENMIKVGMTRRLDPMDRIRELGSASVPFRFDVHAIVFSKDAVGLENAVHTELADRRVNRVNLHREFFYATPAEVRDILLRHADNYLIEFQEEAEAPEWRRSKGMQAAPS